MPTPAIQRGGQGDDAKAMSFLDEAMAISAELGMRPLTERVDERLNLVQEAAKEVECRG